MSASERVTIPRTAAMAAVAFELATAELVHRLPPFSHVLGRVTLDLASGMTETHLSPLSSQNSESTAALRAPPHSWLTVAYPFHLTACLHLLWSSTMLESRCLG